jgi:hypothetical protein
VQVTAGRRLIALILALGFAGGSVSACLGWQDSAQSRMACCQQDDVCPADASGSTAASAGAIADQSAADRCCAAAEQHRSSGIQTVVVVHQPAAAPLPLAWLPAPIITTALTPTSTFATGPPLHLRLSVLLV